MGGGHETLRDDDSLNEYFQKEKLKEKERPKNQKNNLLTFKKEVEKKLDFLMNDGEEWEIYHDEMQDRIKRRYQQHRYNDDEQKPVFITQDEEFIDLDLDMLRQRRDTQKFYELQKKCE